MVAAVFELVNVGPHLSLPAMIVDGALAAGGTARVQFGSEIPQSRFGFEFDENAAHFLDVIVLADQVLIAEQVAETQFAGFALGFAASVKWSIFGPQLLG